MIPGLRAVLPGPAVLAVAEEIALHVETAGPVLAGVGAARVHVDLHESQTSLTSPSFLFLLDFLLLSHLSSTNRFVWGNSWLPVLFPLSLSPVHFPSLLLPPSLLLTCPLFPSLSPFLLLLHSLSLSVFLSLP